MTDATLLTVEEVADDQENLWSAYVGKRPDATLFHDWRWLDAVADAYPCRNFRLVAKRDGLIVGVAPLTLVSSPFFGRSLVSVAYGVGGGVIADDVIAARAIGDYALALGHRLRVRHVEFRGGAAPGDSYVLKSGCHVSFERPLPAQEDALIDWLPRKRRAEVRKAISTGGAAQNNERIANTIDQFYSLYAASLRNHGTPVMPKRFIAALAKRFGDEFEISIVENSGAPIAGLASFWRPDRVMPYYIGAGAKARETRAFDFLYYQLMKRAVERGVAIFDFGRSKADSTHAETKRHWGFEARPVAYHVALVNATTPPNLSPKNPKFQALIGIWRRLPLPVANFLGPMLARNFP